MAEYRFYLLDRRQATIATREMEFDTDAAAMTEASMLRAMCHVVEVWTGPKIVARILSPEALEQAKNEVISQRQGPGAA